MKMLIVALIIVCAVPQAFGWYQARTGRWLSRDPIGEMGGMNLYAVVSNQTQNEVDALGLTSLTTVEEGTTYYTWHLGWVDSTHYTPPKELIQAWAELREARDNELVVFPLSMTVGTLNPIRYEVCIRAAESEEARKEQLLHAWVTLSEEFEKGQGSICQNVLTPLYGIIKGEREKVRSSFSSEDLVSNLIAFYSVVDDRESSELIEEYGKPLYQENDNPILQDAYRRFYSVQIWSAGHGVEPGHREWSPGLLGEEELRESLGDDIYEIFPSLFGSPRFPDRFQRYRRSSDGVILERK